MYKTTVYTLVNSCITRQKQQISAKKVTLLSSTLTLQRCRSTYFWYLISRKDVHFVVQGDGRPH